MPSNDDHLPEAMERLYAAHYRWLVLWANTFVNDLPVAEDLVQDLFADVWVRKIYLRLDGGPPERAFLRVAVRNRCLNFSKKRGLVFSQADDMAAALDEWDEEREQVHAMLDGLAPRSREVLGAVFVEGLKYREAAERFGISLSTVKTLIGRAVERLRKTI